MSDELLALAVRARDAWREYGRTYALASRKGDRTRALRAAVEAEDRLAAKFREENGGRKPRSRRAKVAA